MPFSFKNELVISSAVGVVSFGAGAAAGYFMCAKKFSKELDELRHLAHKLELFADQAELDLQAYLEEEAPFVDPNQASLFLEEEHFSMTESTSSTEDVVHEKDPSHSNYSVFSEFSVVDENWDYDVEIRARELNPGKPYVIHRDEFEDNDTGYSQTTVTWYEGDSILADEKDVPIYNPHTVVGDICFGRGSGDPNVFYVRNDRLNAEYEVLKDHGHYTVEILGHQIEEDFDNDDHTINILKFKEE